MDVGLPKWSIPEEDNVTLLQKFRKYCNQFSRSVKVIRMLSKGTIEEGMLRCAQGKLQLEKEMIGKGVFFISNTSPHDFRLVNSLQ